MSNKDDIHVIRSDELLNILKALQLTGGCDERTLAIVAQATGVGKFWTMPADIRIERPVYLLEVES